MIEEAKKLFELIKKGLNASDAIQAQSFINDLQDTIQTLREKCFECEKTVMKLQDEIANYENWEQEKDKYEPVQIGPFTFAYKLKGTKELFCEVCFHKERMPFHIKSLRIGPELECPNCKNKFIKDWSDFK